ncbi:aldehyde dehydrogenase family protein [Paracoccus jeotgali]|uniref:aldehyde dehydrogenase (NAD(+)) n=1 Tax=Paracoccus jeotgali TaxID=2065379 RepID=A0A2K9MKZ9_9RHOB|nr:aldehyde dehydrogenase family protein [Paracoccus jeotgali]AUM75756.1 aldehyde dehydrogenase family protein [Paracoccus jeotgali]
MTVHDIALVNGTIAPVQGKRHQDLTSPLTGQQDRRTAHADDADVDAAVSAARDAFPAWSQTDAATRRKVIEALADGIEQRADDLAAAINAEVGTPEKIARAVQASLPVHVLRGFAADLDAALADETIGHSTITHRPIGVIAAITPWNYPLHQAMAKIGAGLAAGCTLVVKPSELTPRTNAMMMEILAETTPAGVVNVVPGDARTGAALVNHPGIDAVSFTGSVEGGRAVAQAAASHLKPCFLELGGKSAGILLDDADPDAALKAMVNGGLLNSGQTCNALTRILVPRAMLHDAAAKVGALADQMATRLGPVISQAQFDRVRGFIARAKANPKIELVTGADPAAGQRGWQVQPAVFLAHDRAAEIVQSEVFGPVIVVLGYDDEDDLIALANDTAYGLAAAIWGADAARIDRIIARLRAGQIDVNGAPFNPRAPFGGFNQSGSGREMGLFGIREFQRPVSVQKKA